MPLVKVEILEGRSSKYKKAILEGIHLALVKAFRIPDYDRIQRLYELSEDNFEMASIKSKQFILIEITAFEGRSYQAKKQLYTEIIKNLGENPGIPGNDITIVLNEVPFDNWGIRGGKPASEVDLGFKVDV